MNVNIQTVHFNADAKLTDLVVKKIEKLQTYHDRIISVEVFLKLDNVVHTLKDKVAEINVHVPRQMFFVKSCTKSFEESFENAFESMSNKVKKHKAKLVHRA